MLIGDSHLPPPHLPAVPLPPLMGCTKSQPQLDAVAPGDAPKAAPKAAQNTPSSTPGPQAHTLRVVYQEHGTLVTVEPDWSFQRFVEHVQGQLRIEAGSAVRFPPLARSKSPPPSPLALPRFAPAVAALCAPAWLGCRGRVGSGVSP